MTDHDQAELHRAGPLVRRGLATLIAAVALLGCRAGAPVAPEGEDPGRLTVDRIFGTGELRTEGSGGARWWPDGGEYTLLEPSRSLEGARDVVSIDPATGHRHVVVPAESLIPPGGSAPLSIADYAFSGDGSRLLVFTNTRRVWRRNTRGDYWVLDLDDGRLRQLGGDAEEATLMFARLSPAGDRVAYVCERDLWVQDLDDLEVHRLTAAAAETIINGTSDWVYEEELGLRCGFRWSPDGERIAYWQIDTEGVGEFCLVDYLSGLYPRFRRFPYPKVGERNPACRVGVISAEGGETRWVTLPGDSREHYIARMQWAAGSEEIVLQRLNRLQNENEVVLADAGTGAARTILTERDEAWVDVAGDPTWLDGGRSFLWTSERDGWRHVWRVSRDGRRVDLLTPGAFDVMGIEGIDEESGWLYYAASPENPTQRYLYRVRLDGSGEAERLTPMEQPGTHTYRVSPDDRWAFHTWSSFGAPPLIELVSLPGHASERVIEDNAGLRARLDELEPCPSRFFRIDIGDGVLLDAWCIEPPGFDPSRRWPLFVHVYGEPAGQTVLDRWGGNTWLWHRMLASRGYLVVSVDNRGTPAPRGREWRKCIYRQVGILASADQAAATRSLLREWPWADPERIGIWGWSGGGSMSLNAIFRHPELYHTAMAVATISNQRFYDTIYQERYMGLPEDNPEGYRDGSPITFANQLEGNLLIVHGTADDNCHYQSCAALVDELIAHDRHFTMMAYPGRTHDIREGRNTTRHLYRLLTRYLEENLPGGPR